MEHVERQEEREQEIRGDLDDLESQSDELEQSADGLSEQTKEAREDFEQKQGSADAPGIQESEGTDVVDRPSPEAEDESDAPAADDE